MRACNYAQSPRHDLLAYRQALRQPASDTVGDTTRRLSEALQSRALAVVASLFRYWTETGYLTANPAAGLVRGGRSRASFAPQRMLPSVLLAACDAWVDEAVAVGDSLVSARRRAIWALYRYAGVRLVELVWSDEAQLPRLDVDDHGSWTLTVLGKGQNYDDVAIMPSSTPRTPVCRAATGFRSLASAVDCA